MFKRELKIVTATSPDICFQPEAFCSLAFSDDVVFHHVLKATLIIDNEVFPGFWGAQHGDHYLCRYILYLFVIL